VNILETNRTLAFIRAGCLVSALLMNPGVSAGETGAEVKRTAEKTVDTRIQTQEAVETWLEEERRLLEEIDAVRGQIRHTAWQRRKTARYRSDLEQKVTDLNRRAAEMETISQELLAVLDETLRNLQAHVASDLPFNRTERRRQLQRVEGILNDYDANLLSKTRVVFDAAAREVDTGHRVDVREEEITVAGQIKQVKLLRIGRVGLYALTMDAGSAYIWDEEQTLWRALERGSRDIEEAVATAEGTRIIGLSRLPMGPPAQKERSGGDAVDQESND
jgi:hypothetical protein